MSALLKDPLLKMRPMEEADIDAVMEVEVRAYPFPWTHGIFRDCLKVGYHCWVYILNETIAGYSVMSVAVGEAHILNVCVAPEHQGRGLGRRLLERMLTQARKEGADTAFLEVRISNRPAIRLYETAGFNEVGLRRGYYPNHSGREDAVVMALSLV